MNTTARSPLNRFSLGQRHRILKLLITASIVSVIGLTIWPGCATAPLRPTKTPISTLQRADFAFIEGNAVSQTELLARVGEPDEHFADLRISGYRLNKLTRRRLWLVFGVLPFGTTGFSSDTGIEVALIEFNANNQVRRFKIVKAYHPETLRTTAENMAKKSVKR